MSEKDNNFTFHTGGGVSDQALSDILHGDEMKKGEVIGPWVIDRVIGRGGMGVVYLAHRYDGAYEQTVAIKHLQTMDAESSLVSRFQNERQILATLDHPNIARLLDGGTTDSGHPYFVMEYIDGEEIVGFCESQALSLTERLKLFLQVAQAVESAHQHLVIHRDIKPSNIIVSKDGEVKLLDFGIARLESESMLQGDLTQLNSTPLTLQFASPEQIQNESITTASDIYQLGLILYQIITGVSPFDHATNPQALMMEICQTTPEKLSKCLEKIDLCGALYKRHWSENVRGDLDAIVSMCLRKNPKDRYLNVSQVIADIRSHMSHHPVMARKGNWWYKSKKTIYRNKAIASLSLMFLAVFTAFLSYSFWAIAQQRDLALNESKKSQETVGFLSEILESADPDIAQGKELTVLDVVNDAASKLHNRFEQQPDVKASLLTTLGKTYSKLGQEDLAQPLLQQAVEIYQQQKPNNQMMVDGYLSLASSMWHQSDYKQAYEVLDRARLYIENQPLLKGKVLTAEADIKLDQGEVKQAQVLIEKALPLFKQSDDSVNYLDALKTLGFAQRSLGLYEQAGESLSEVLSQSRIEYGKNSRQVAEAMTNLANIKTLSGKYPEAQSLLKQSRELSVFLLGESHPTIAKIDMSAGILHYYLQDYQKCLDKWNSAKLIYKQVYGSQHPRVVDVNNNLGAVLHTLDRFEEAENILLESIQINKALYGEESTTLNNLYYNLINNYKSQNKFTESIAPVEKLLRLSKNHEGDLSQKQLGRNYVISARVYRFSGDLAKAITLLKLTDEYFQNVPDMDTSEHLLVLTELMQIYKELNQNELSKEFESKAKKFAQANQLDFDPDPELLRKAEL